MHSVMEVECGVASEIEIKTGPRDPSPTLFVFSAPGTDEFRYVSRNGSHESRGKLFGIAINADEIAKYRSEHGSCVWTRLESGELAIETKSVKIGDRIAINYEGFPGTTYTTRPIISIEVP